MNRQQIKELLPIIQAYAEGKPIEIKTKEGEKWCTFEENDIQYLPTILSTCDFRIKPESKYRPFKDAKECWKEMLEHNPLGWFKDKKAEEFFTLNCISDKDPRIKTYEYLFNDCVFMDGSICGVKVEE